MALILSWVLFPLVLAAIGVGWGILAERASGARIDGALLVPLGLAAALVTGGTLNAFDVTAAAAVPVVAAGAAAGLALAWTERHRLGRWPLVAAAGVLLVYGAPVLLTGQATFAGIVRLDDTAAWFNIVDHVTTGPHSPAGELPSDYALKYDAALGPHYPRGAFILPGVARALSGVDIAWVFQPYLACCAAALALCLFGLVRPLVPSAPIRALIAFLAAQSALLYGYSLWGGIKELTAAFLLALVAALAATAVRRRPGRPLELLPLALAGAALLQTLGVGAAGWLAIALAPPAVAWLLDAYRAKRMPLGLTPVAWLGGLIAALIVPVWIVLNDFLSTDQSLFSSGQSERVLLGNLGDPLSVFQLVGIWPVGDFRLVPPGFPAIALIALALLAAGGALWVAIRRRVPGLPLYTAAALGGCAIAYLAGATPWVIGKTLAIASPALLLAALCGAAMLYGRDRLTGILGLAVFAAGVLWGSALAYHDALIAPRPRLAELQRIGELVAGNAPTLLNEYNVYGTEHFLRAGAPVSPSDYRSVDLALRDGTLLDGPAWSDLDSLPLATIEGYPSIVIRRAPSESRPPSNYQLIWRGRYYELWQRRAVSSTMILDHVPLGESNALPFCGRATNASEQPRCSLRPVATPSCTRIRRLARRARDLDARLVARVHPGPITARADESLWPAAWLYDRASGTLTATASGQLTTHLNVPRSQRYELWLGGSFARGFEVTVDGRSVGRVKNELSSPGGYVPVASVTLTAGTHTVVLTYPKPDLTPGSGDAWFTTLATIALQPQDSRDALISVPPNEAAQLCGRSLDWIEIVR